MANAKQAITSLLTEHFRYTPLTLLDDIINTINELVYRAVSAVEQGLTNAPAESLGFADRAVAEKRIPERDEDGSNLYPESRSEIEHGVHQLETLLDASVDKNFDKLEIFVLRSILNVPEDLAPWIRLSHYEHLDLTAPANNITAESLHLLRRKVYETRKLNNALQTERDRNARLITDLRSLLQTPETKGTGDESLDFLINRNPEGLGLPRSEARNDQATTAAAKLTLSQVPALRQLIAELRPKAGTISAPKLGAAAEERREHIETEARRILERSGANLHTGEGLLGTAGSASRISSEDVKGIEAVVGVLENTGASARTNDDVMEQ